MAFIPSSGSVAAWLQSDNASVITVGSGSVFAIVQNLQGASVSGTVIANQGTTPWVITGSVQASLTPAANQSVSGTVGASIIGLTPVAVTNTPSISGTVNVGNTVTINPPSVYGNISGSVVAFINNTPAVSVQGTVFVSGSVITIGTAAPNQSISGTVQAQIQGSVATVIIGGSIAASFTPPANQSVSGAVSVSNFPTTQNVSGSVVATQGTTPWTVTSSIAGGIFPISGSVAATITNPSLNINGSVAAWLQSSNASVITVGTAVPNQSVSGTVGASIIGLPPVNVTNFPTTQNVSGSVVAFVTGTPAVSVQGTVFISGSVITVGGSGPANQSVSGTVQTQVQASVAVVIIGGSILTSSTANQSVSGTVGASIIGSVGVNQGAAASLVGGWPIINGEAADATGTFTNATQTTSVTNNNLDGYGNTLISINGTYGTATAVFEGSDDGGTTWYTVAAARDDSNVIETGYTSITNVSRTWQINNSGFDSIRVRSTAVASGTVNIRISSSAAPNSSGATVAIGAALPAGTNAIGAVFASITGTVIASVSGSVGIVGNPSISGTVLITNTPSISGTVLVNNGSVVAFQGTIPWITNFQNSSIIALQSGSVVSINQGSVATVQIGQTGTVITSIAGSYAVGAASVVSGLGVLTLGERNDTLASIYGANGTYSPHTIGQWGETIIGVAPQSQWINSTASTFTGIIQPVITSVAGSFINVTGIQIVNNSANNAYLTFSQNGVGSVQTGSIVGYTVAPANGGSNITFPIPMRMTTVSRPFMASVSAVSSVFVTAQGFYSTT